MIKLKDILLESTTPDIFIPRRIENRLERMISLYVRNGSKGNLNLRHMNLTKLPEILKNVNVEGYFYCDNNKLISLTGAPETVGKDFFCNNNLLTSLEGSPKNVGRDFYGDNNLLTSLEGAPKTVGGSFYCYNNPVQFTEQQVRAVCDVKKKVYV
jgi:hypothetical protein